MGSKNHEVVPTPLIAQISGLRNGGVNKLIGSLAKRNLVSRVQNSKYDGYRLTYGGYDYLAMRAMSRRDTMHSVGNQIGVGKESDIYIVADSEGKEMVLKIHRLGRISFRSIKDKRDYLGKRKSASWMYMSRLSAQKEWAFMKVLREHGFPVPLPIDQARHCILMEFIDAFPLRQVAAEDVPSPGKLYSTLMDLIVHFARAGLIHGDFNEFNILIRRESGEPVVIDFPQMVSTSHENAEWYFNRDVECIRTFFRRRFNYESSLYPKFRKATEETTEGDNFQLDIVVAASGFGRKDQKILEEYMETVKAEEETDDKSEEEEDEESEEESEEDEEPLDIPVAIDTADSGRRETKEGDRAPIPTQKGPGDENDESLDAPPEATDRALSRSPPQSRPTSPQSLVKLTSALDLNGIKGIVSADLTKARASEKRKHHSKSGVRRAGRPQGSKAKQDTRVKLDRGGIWE
ncbi:hypothetical protein DXG03_007082 [Asterophora parasitica]|uniref:non-specific serine/threonine protein kinase n=1 Tax=Asterophora parasitica TaxID=117018 RepID=A0A9P7GCI5_9AGAR|nr:hypothetical protein DXG03_007082 [Asterophora parasitica]